MNNEEGLHLPPSAVEAEQSILGSMMMDSRLIDGVSSELEQRDFYRNDHQLIYSEIIRLDQSGESVDVVTVSDALTKSGNGEKAGGMQYIRSLAKNTPNTGHAASYAKIVREKAIMRRLIEAAQDTLQACYAPKSKSVTELLDFAESKVLEVSQGNSTKDDSSRFIQPILTEVIDRVGLLFEGKCDTTGVISGYTDLDSKVGGFSGGDLAIIAGRPSMGKTSLAMNIAEYMVLHGSSGAVFSMEMPASQLGSRLLASMGRVSMQKMRNGQLHNDDWPKLTSAVAAIAEKNLQIDDTPALNILELRSKARRMASRSNGLDFIVIDYLQLMSGNSAENRTGQLSTITRGLKALAKELDCPIFCLSQLNRGLEQRPNKRPVMSDLRESGAIEQDADIIMFVYRHEVYEPETDQKGLAEIIIAKQRNGPIGTVRLAWLGEFTRFENYANPNFNRN